MSMVETIRDVKNNLLSRREITCTFKGLAGKLKKLEAIDMVSKQYKLDGKVIVPIMLKNDTGRPMISGTFYVYDDEKLAHAHLKPAIFKRLEKAKGGGEKTEGEAKEAVAEKETKGKPVEKKEATTEKKEVQVEKKEAKTPEKKEAKGTEDKKEKPAKKESAEPKEKSK
jgi:ribosomal protein S24E